jgi:hypothetical protein
MTARERGPCVDGAENEADEEEPLERARPSVLTALEPVGAATMDLRCCTRHVEARRPGLGSCPRGSMALQTIRG